jgi:hypothetical protein
MKLICEITFWVTIFIGSIIIVCNWIIFLKRYVLKNSNSSWIPLIGGGLCGCALLLPCKNLGQYFIIPLLIDYGCFIGLIHTVLFIIFKVIIKGGIKNK